MNPAGLGRRIRAGAPPLYRFRFSVFGFRSKTIKFIRGYSYNLSRLKANLVLVIGKFYGDKQGDHGVGYEDGGAQAQEYG